jgi:hypothetical protein
MSFLDTGHAERGIACSRLVSALCLLLNIGPHASCLDYGGGTGLFVRLMRDTGYDFAWFDQYSPNIHATGFEGDPSRHHTLLTCFEVFEHLPDPNEQLTRLFAPEHDFLLVGTVLHTGQGPGWWYYCPEAGTHVSFYSARTMAYVARRFGYASICGRDYTLFLRNHRVPSGTHRLIERVLSDSRIRNLVLRLHPRSQSRSWSDRLRLLDRLSEGDKGPPSGPELSGIGPVPSSTRVLSWKRRVVLRCIEIATATVWRS